MIGDFDGSDAASNIQTGKKSPGPVPRELNLVKKVMLHLTALSLNAALVDELLNWIRLATKSVHLLVTNPALGKPSLLQ